MMKIEWKSGLRVHADCGGEAEILPDQGYFCTTCGAQSFSEILRDEEQERQEQKDELERQRERDEYERAQGQI